MENKQKIGLTDINGKEIIADSSIVQFNFIDSKNQNNPLEGVFTWNDIELRYEIDIPEQFDPFTCLSYNPETMKDFIIIDTVSLAK